MNDNIFLPQVHMFPKSLEIHKLEILQDLWGRLQFGFQYIRQRQHDVVRSIDI